VRIVIAGGPGAGKSTLGRELAKEYGLTLRSTDELLELPWSAQSERVADWLLGGGSYVIEGVRAVAGLRKAIARVTPALAIDRVIFLHSSKRPLGDQARRMSRQISGEWLESVRRALQQRGIPVEDRGTTPGTAFY
jgi:hypothetical protein